MGGSRFGRPPARLEELPHLRLARSPRCHLGSPEDPPRAASPPRVQPIENGRQLGRRRIAEVPKWRISGGMIVSDVIGNADVDARRGFEAPPPLSLFRAIL